VEFSLYTALMLDGSVLGHGAYARCVRCGARAWWVPTLGWIDDAVDETRTRCMLADGR